MFVQSDFVFDGVRGIDYFGLKLIKTDAGFFEQPFGISRKTITDKIKNRGKVVHYGFDDEVLTFTLKLYKESGWDYLDKVAISKWLIRDTYKDFMTDDYPLIFKIAAVSKPKFYNLGNDQGYLEIEFESDAPYAYSPISISDFDLSSNAEDGTIITLENKSNVFEIYRPELQFKIISGTSVKLENLSNRGKTIEFTDLQVGETIYIDCQNERIQSDLSGTRLNNLTDHQFFELAYGVNRVRVKGSVTMQTRMQFPMMV